MSRACTAVKALNACDARRTGHITFVNPRLPPLVVFNISNSHNIASHQNRPHVTTNTLCKPAINMTEMTIDDGAPASNTVDTAETTAQLTSLKAAATKEYSLRNYAGAADLYSEATELQTELNGEMSPENADLLYAYGRCLYHVAVSNSDVLGGKVASGEEPKKKKRKTAPAPNGDAPKAADAVATEVPGGATVDLKAEVANGNKEEDATSKPFFQISGDENWTDGEDEEDGEGEDGEAEEEEDDFAIAYEILDVARVLLTRKLEVLEQKKLDMAGKGKAAQDDTLSPEARGLTERLADTHDLQAEISLENERFSDAVTDSRAALELKLKLFPTESSIVAEAHYKLSLALEFSSVTTISGEGAEVAEGKEPETQVDEEAGKESATQMEEAIESCRLRIEKEKAALANMAEDEKSKKQKSITDVEEMVTDMKQRVIHPTTSLKE